ncbi:M14 family metallopeptidase [Sutcliffiella rhizosphaerae]|uniref:Gamma-D-glutamyl-L-diamino acid endopeptidase 1 n=1 Tax=Sutcliffiella rhizosphaerae TaxID=2880967 RepID=A0ABN8A6E1_9BACI|nr:M14 family metallopeptidase [Sutcliffiella rhizosphaerae]CAG9619296.1 Gamma-D-glutamyl-L-diamino acid endopeptidase 1 [Sutcliffiella rhizosphaerae]
MKVRVRKGDSIWYYSQLFNISQQLVEDSNKDKQLNPLANGIEIAIPGFIRIGYIVKPGETIEVIANLFNLPVDSIYLLNQNLRLSLPVAGDEILVPKRVVESVVQNNKPYDFHSLQRDISKLQEIYPFLSCSTIGQSVMGKPLLHLGIGKGSKKVHWNASFHANEWITSAVTMNLLNEYLLGLTNSTPIRGLSMEACYHQTRLSIVPMVNPDGVDLVVNGPPFQTKYDHLVKEINKNHQDFQGWKSNIRGVDLNKHFPANWMIEKERKEEKVPSPRDYPGETPLTEPEAIAMAKLAEKEKFDLVVAVHTQGEEFYWGYEGLEPEVSCSIAYEFERVSTYKSVRYVDSHAGFKDWYIQQFRKPGFTLELGKGINPLPLSQYGTIYQKTLGIFLASLYL